MKTINEMKTTYAVLFTVIIVFLLGCLGKLKQTNDRIDEITEPVVVASVNFDDNESLNWFHRTLRRLGVVDALREKGAREGSTVAIGDMEFDFVD